MTTQVVEITSSRLGQVTCFISTRTSCRNSRAFPIVPLTLLPNSEPIPPCDSSFFTLTAFVALNPRSFIEDGRSCPSRSTLAGEEGLEPPYPVLETGVLAVGRLPYDQNRLSPPLRKEKVTSLPCAPSVCGTCYRTSLFPSVRCASSCS